MGLDLASEFGNHNLITAIDLLDPWIVHSSAIALN